MLDLFFRKYAWTANLVLLFAAAWLSAKTVNTLVGALVRPRPQADVSVANVRPPPAPLPVALDDAKIYHLIGVEPPKPAEEEEQPAVERRPQNCQDRSAAPVRSELRLALVAGVVADRARSSLATITDLNSRSTTVVGVGDPLPGGGEFLGLERVRDEQDATGNAFRVVAIVCNAGTKEYLEFEGGETLASAGNLGNFPVPAPTASRAAAPAGAPMEGVRSTGANKYEIDSNVIDSTLGNLNTIATQARIIPNFKNGVPNGFKLISIQPGSLYASIGIENGDVIQRINGYEINSPEKALELYQKLRESGHVTIELDRMGQTVRKEYTITGR